MNRLEWTEKSLDNLFTRYEKLLEFVKECANGEKYIKALSIKYNFSNEPSNTNTSAIDLLKEIGEQCER